MSDPTQPDDGLTHFQIQCCFSGAVRFEGRFGSLRLAVEAAVSARASLSRANLAGASLAGANLAGANLARASLARASLVDANLAGASLARASLVDAKVRTKAGVEATLTGARPIIQIGPIGSRSATLTVLRTDAGMLAQTGCFGPAPLDEFAAAVEREHGATKHGDDYRAAIALARVVLGETVSAEAA